jgi:hypothetical protein
MVQPRVRLAHDRVVWEVVRPDRARVAVLLAEAPRSDGGITGAHGLLRRLSASRMPPMTPGVFFSSRIERHSAAFCGRKNVSVSFTLLPKVSWTRGPPRLATRGEGRDRSWAAGHGGREPAALELFNGRSGEVTDLVRFAKK